MATNQQGLSLFFSTSVLDSKWKRKSYFKYTTSGREIKKEYFHSGRVSLICCCYHCRNCKWVHYALADTICNIYTDLSLVGSFMWETLSHWTRLHCKACSCYSAWQSHLTPFCALIYLGWDSLIWTQMFSTTLNALCSPVWSCTAAPAVLKSPVSTLL